MRFKSSLMIIILFVFFLIGCADSGEQVAPAIEEPPAENDQEISGPLMAKVDVPLVVDGSTTGYPAAPVEEMAAVIHLAHDGEYLYLHLELAVVGWISVGFNQSGGGMDGANMILGYLDGDSAAFRNDLGQGRNHSEIDSPAVEEFYLAYDEGTAVMEFSYPLDFPADQGFNLDGLLPGESYTVILSAHNSSADISNIHSSRGSFTFTVEP